MRVHYVGRLLEGGAVFDSSRERGEPLDVCVVDRSGCCCWGGEKALGGKALGGAVLLPAAVGLAPGAHVGVGVVCAGGRAAWSLRQCFFAGRGGTDRTAAAAAGT
eukprot:COSAG01_NODE_6280_length_3755_cov_33.946663_4_plen_105_part_00